MGWVLLDPTQILPLVIPRHVSGGLYQFMPLVAYVSLSSLTLVHQYLGHLSLENCVCQFLICPLVSHLSTTRVNQVNILVAVMVLMAISMMCHLLFQLTLIFKVLVQSIPYQDVFIDDFSHCTWVFLMKNHFDFFFYIFQSLYAKIQIILALQLKFYELIMQRNICLPSFSPF